MNRPENLERELTVWFADTAAPRVPDYTDDILWQTAHTSQRSRRSFPERWLPMSVITLGRRTFKPLPWRTIGLLAAIALLVAAVAVYVGSRPRLPPPYGLAANGLVAYALNGDIYAVDPISGTRQAIATGSDDDTEPRWSLDGTRVAFLRESGDGVTLVIVDRQSREVLATSDRLLGVDDDAFSWSPDGRSIAIGAWDGASPKLFIVDATDGTTEPLAVDYVAHDVHWRPPDGRELMFLGRAGSEEGLFLVDVTEPPALTPVAHGVLRPAGFTPDGRKFVYTRGDADVERLQTYVVDLTTGEEVILDAAFGHVSNDGRRIVALDDIGRVCVVGIDGGRCVAIGRISQAYEGHHAAGALWSPDDEWIISRLASGDDAILLDAGGGGQDQPSWMADGAQSWQRQAP